jgi:dihydroorotase
MPGTQKLECELTLRAGQVVWDLNGRAAADWATMPTEPQGGNATRPRRTSSQEQ